MTNEGLSNTAKRNKLYSQALGSSGIALFTSNEVASEDVTQAFTEMKTQLVDTPIDENDGEGLRPYLILAGFEDLPETEADLINWIANRKYMIKRHAEKAYNMYGTEKQYIPKGNRIHTALSDCKIKDFVWDSPCNYPKTASFGTPHTDSIKLLIYKEKRRFSASSS